MTLSSPIWMVFQLTQPEPLYIVQSLTCLPLVVTMGGFSSPTRDSMPLRSFSETLSA